MATVFVRVEEDGVILNDNVTGVLRSGIITMAEYREALTMFAPALVLFSSSVDFPQEYTSNPDVIALCDDIRSVGEESDEEYITRLHDTLTQVADIFNNLLTDSQLDVSLAKFKSFKSDETRTVRDFSAYIQSIRSLLP